MKKLILLLFIFVAVNLQAQNVGIGNTNPEHLLDINARMRIRGGADTNTSAGVFFGGLIPNQTVNKGFVGMNTDTAIAFFGYSGARWILTGDVRNGNVAIGNGSRMNRAGLTVDRKVGATHAIFGNTATGVSLQSNAPGIGFNSYYYGGHKAIDDGFAGYIGVDPFDGGMQFSVSPVTGDSATDVTINPALFIKPNGNTGIGTVNPLARLHVADSAVVFTRNTTPLNTNANPPVEGAGVRMMWYPEKAAFRVGAVDDGTILGQPGYCITCPNNWDRDSIGSFSFASGYNSKASGIYSTAFNNSTASGTGSTAMGHAGNASGYISTVMGVYTVAKAVTSLSIGSFNDNNDNPNPNFLDWQDRIFQIGNGTTNNARSNAITVLRNGNTGIGTVNPAAKLHVADSAVVFTRNTTPLNTNANPPVEGAGVRMMWYPEKAAFRVGAVDDGTMSGSPGNCPPCVANWNRDNIGNFSFAGGYNATAAGQNSFSFGHYSTAVGQGSIAIGTYAIASGDVSTAMGRSSSATGRTSISAGNNMIAKAANAVALGGFNDNSDNPDPVIMQPDDRIFQLGNGSSIDLRKNALTILRNGNTGIGTVTPNAPLQFANTAVSRKIVLWETANNDHQFYGFGINGFTLRYQTPAATDDHVFYAGINSSSSAELFRIKGNGNVGIGTSTPSVKLHVIGDILATGTITPSDIRYKMNIETISNPLAKLQQLDGVTYRFNQSAFPEWKFDNKLQYGLIAQEVEKVFPEMVKTIDEKGYKGVEYVKLIPVLLEAIKELNSKMELLEKENKEMKTLLQQLLKNK